MIFFVIHLVLRTREPDLRNRSLRKADRTLVSPISKKNAGNSQACWRLLLHYPSFSGATAGHFSRFCVLQRRSGKENRIDRQRLPLESVDKAGTEPSDTLAHLDCGRRVAMGDSLLAGQVAKIRSVQMIFASPDKRRRLREPPRSLAQRQNKRFQSPCRLHRTDNLRSANVTDATSAIRLRAGRVFPAFAAILIPASVQDSQCPSEHQVRLPSELVSMCP